MCSHKLSSRGSTAKKSFFKILHTPETCRGCSPENVLSLCKKGLFSSDILVTFDQCKLSFLGSCIVVIIGEMVHPLSVFYEQFF